MADTLLKITPIIPFPISPRLGVIDAILSLFFSSGPSAIGRFIITIIVDPFNRVLGRWSWSHIGKKVFKRVQPSFADGDATARISLAPGSIFTIATSLHGSPGIVFRYQDAILRSCTMFTNSFSLKAPARKMFSRDKITSLSKGCVAAIALANPYSFFPTIAAQADDKKTTVAIINEIVCFHKLRLPYHQLVCQRGRLIKSQTTSN